MTNQSVNSKSPTLAASPSSSAVVPTESPSSLAALSIHNEEVPAFDLVGRKCENQRYSGEVPNKPCAYVDNEMTLTIDNLDCQNLSESFPLNTASAQDNNDDSSEQIPVF